MAKKTAETDRSIEVLVRVDGQGEFRDGVELVRASAANADELRGELMERAMRAAMESGANISVRIIDVDGIYQLICGADGSLDQIGGVEPLQPGDTELTPATDEADDGEAQTADEADEANAEPRAEIDDADLEHADQHLREQRDGGYRELFVDGADAVSQQVQEPFVDDPATRIPREDMLAPSYDELITHSPAIDEIEDAPIQPTGLFDDELADGLGEEFDQATFANGSASADATDTADEQLDSLLASEEELTPAQRGRLAALKAVREQRRAQEETPNEWAPAFLRDRAAAAEAPKQPAEPTLPTAPAADAPTAAVAGGAGTTAAAAGNAPTLDDFFADRKPERAVPAEQGWRASVRRMTGGAITLGPGKRERAERDELASIRRVFDGPRTIVVVNPKGGAHKTTATLMIAAMFGIHRGGYTLAWDNNETRGTLGWRSQPGKNTTTAVDLLRELPRFAISGGATIADIDRFVRNQGDAKFDVLASDDDAASAAIIDDDAFSRLHSMLSRFYRVMVIDTGNNMRASNWEAALEVADQLVIISTAREDTAASAAWLADGLRERGYEDKLANAVTILSSPSAKEDAELTNKLRKHFEALTRAVVAVPYDHEFVGGGALNTQRLAPETLRAWRHAAAVIAEGL